MDRTQHPPFFLHKSTDMSENGILLLFYIFLSYGNEEKKMIKGGGGVCVKRGDAVSCPQVPVGINTVYMYM